MTKLKYKVGDWVVCPINPGGYDTHCISEAVAKSSERLFKIISIGDSCAYHYWVIADDCGRILTEKENAGLFKVANIPSKYIGKRVLGFWEKSIIRRAKYCEECRKK